MIYLVGPYHSYEGVKAHDYNVLIPLCNLLVVVSGFRVPAAHGLNTRVAQALVSVKSTVKREQNYSKKLSATVERVSLTSSARVPSRAITMALVKYESPYSAALWATHISATADLLPRFTGWKDRHNVSESIKATGNSYPPVKSLEVC